MKKTLVTTIIILFAVTAQGQKLKRGYRGFIEFIGDISSMEYTFDNNKTAFFAGAATSHGFQFNPNFWLGAGLGGQYSNTFHQWTYPLFAEVRTDQYWGGLTTFGSLRIGINCFDGGGFYLSPSIGYRLHIYSRLNANIGLGLTMTSLNVPKFKRVFDGRHDPITYAWTEHKSKLFFSFRVGFDF